MLIIIIILLAAMFRSGLSDVLVDLTCEYEPMVPDGGDPEASYMAHGGMLYVRCCSSSCS